LRNKFPYTRIPLVDPTDMTQKAENALWVPTLRVRLGVQGGKRSPRFPAFVDSGSPWCIFKSDLADYLGIELEEGEKAEVGGILAGIKEPMYFHKVILFVEDHWTLSIRAGFVKKLCIPGILGRDGFFDHFLVQFDQSCKPALVQLEKIERPN